VSSDHSDPLEIARSLNDIVKSVSGDADTDVFAKMAHAIETIIIGFYGMAKAQDTHTFATHFVQMCHSVYGKSIGLSIYEMLSSMGITGSQANDSTDPDWICAVRLMLEDWSAFVNSPLMCVGTKIIGMVVALGFCSLEDLKFEVCGLQLFSNVVVPEKLNLSDFASTAMSVLSLLVNQGYECFKYKTYTPLLYSDDKIVPIMKKCAECEKLSRLHHTGNLIDGLIDEAGFANMLKETKDDLLRLANFVRSAPSKKLLMDKYTKIKLLEAQFQAKLSTGGLKIAPFVIGIFGGSSVGKSSINAILTACLLRAMGVSYLDKDQLHVNSMEQYVSGAHNGITSMSYDEMGQIKPKYMTTPDIVSFMQMANNHKVHLNMAELELKGVTAPQPALLTNQRNVKDGGAREIIQEPLAFSRREHYIANTFVRPEFATHGMLDSRKVRDYYGGAVIIPDAWIIRLEKVVPRTDGVITSKTNIIKTEYDYEVVTTPDGKKMDAASIHEVIDFLIEEAKEYMAFQKQLVESSTEIGSKIPFCDKHKKMLSACGCQVPNKVCEEKEPPLPGYNCNEGDENDVDEVSTLTPVQHTSGFDRMIRDAVTMLYNRNSTTSFLQSLDPAKFPYKKTEEEPVQTTVHLGLPQYRPRGGYKKLYKGVTTALVSATVMGIYDSATSVFKDTVESNLDDLYYMYKRKGPFDWINWIPEEYFHHSFVQDTLVHKRRSTLLMVLLFILSFIGGYYVLVLSSGAWILPLLSAYIWFCYRNLRSLHDRLIWAQLVQSHTDVPAFVKSIREDHKTALFRASAFLALSITVYKVWKFMNWTFPWQKTEVKEVLPLSSADKKVLPVSTVGQVSTEPKKITHNTITPKTDEDFARKNSLGKLDAVIAKENNWGRVYRAEIPVSPKALTTCKEDFHRLVQGNLLMMEWVCPVRNVSCNVLILMVCSNRGLTVGHFAPESDVSIRFTKQSGDSSANFTCFVGPKSVVPFGQDSALVYVPKGGAFKDLLPFFTDGKPDSEYGYLCVRRKDHNGEVFKAGGISPAFIENIAGRIDVYKYDLPEVPWSGLCGAPLLVDGMRRAIVGIHQAGDLPELQTTKGYAVPILKTELLQALADMSERWFEPLNAGTMPTSSYGTQLIYDQSLHAKSPLRTMVHGHFEFLGSGPGRATFHPTAHLLPSCRLVEEKFGVKCNWRAPKMEKPWETTVNYMANCSHGVEPEYLDWAQTDYQEQFDRMEFECPHLLNEVRVLTDEEAINGLYDPVDIRFMDAIDMTTGAGLGGKKKKELVTEMEDPLTGRIRRFPTQELSAEMQRIEKCFEREERCYTIFKMCPKDEAVNKDKIRFFCCGQFAFTLVARKYTAYLLWLWKQSIEYSECCVGMNPHGPEWDEWTKWHTEYSKERIFDGDYSKYDLTQSSMVKASTAQLFLHIAAACPNLGPRDKLMIRGIFTEIMYPLVCVNGDIVQFFGFSPSGVFGTVEYNGSDSGHILRSAAKKLNSDLVCFRDAVKLGNYGDDVAGGVHEDHQYFTARNVAPILLQWGYKFTPADKSEDFTSDWNPGGAFLKMTSGEIEDCEIAVGALEKASIMKPLMIGTQSVLTPEAQVATNINGAMHAIFAHGREEYEDMRAKLIEVAQELDILVWCSRLKINYDAHRAEWFERYMGEP
jgi:hypothetical protein